MLKQQYPGEAVLPHLDVVFVAPSTHPLASAHLPCLVHTASLAHPLLPRTRVAVLDADASKRLAEAVGVPRWSMVGVKHGSTLASSLSHLVENIAHVEAPWFDQAYKIAYQGTNIAETGTVGLTGNARKT